MIKYNNEHLYCEQYFASFMFGTVHITHQLTGVVLYLLVWVTACLWQQFIYLLMVTMYRKL